MEKQIDNSAILKVIQTAKESYTSQSNSPQMSPIVSNMPQPKIPLDVLTSQAHTAITSVTFTDPSAQKNGKKDVFSTF